MMIKSIMIILTLSLITVFAKDLITLWKQDLNLQVNEDDISKDLLKLYEDAQ